jgi:hypothetical protein
MQPSVVPAKRALARAEPGPYRVIYQEDTSAEAVLKHVGLWLWVPAFAGTTR